MPCIANATTETEEHEGIVITDKMIEAGVRVLCGYETLTRGEAYWAEEVYRAMREVAVLDLEDQDKRCR